jgi:hypothetical protein
MMPEPNKSLMPKRIRARLRHLIDLSFRIEKESSLAAWHSHVLMHVMTQAGEAVCHVYNSATDEKLKGYNMGYMAWGVRNLYECRVWLRYCMQPENAKLLVADREQDLADIADALVKAAAKQTEKEWLDRALALRKTVGKIQAEAKVDQKSLRLRITDVAASLKLADDGSYRYLSKLTHATSLTITSTEAGMLSASTINGLTILCLKYLEAIITDVESLLPSAKHPTKDLVMD